MVDLKQLGPAGIVLAIFMFTAGFVAGTVTNGIVAKPQRTAIAKPQPIDEAQNRRIEMLERQAHDLSRLTNAVSEVAKSITEINARLHRIEQKLEQW